MNAVEVFVPGTPIPQGSKRALMSASTHRPIIVDANRAGLAEWRADITAYLGRARLSSFQGPVGVRLVFIMPRPKTHYLPANRKRPAPTLREDAPYFHERPPDLDKLTRAVFDAMTDARIVNDDCQVVGLRAEKRYTYDGTVGVHIRVTGMESDGNDRTR